MPRPARVAGGVLCFRVPFTDDARDHARVDLGPHLCCRCRYQLLRGRKARFVPGWDTHGLPIELKVLQALPMEERRSLSTLELRQRAAAYARATIDAQREQFKR